MLAQSGNGHLRQTTNLGGFNRFCAKKEIDSYDEIGYLVGLTRPAVHKMAIGREEEEMEEKWGETNGSWDSRLPTFATASWFSSDLSCACPICRVRSSPVLFNLTGLNCRKSAGCSVYTAYSVSVDLLR